MHQHKRFAPGNADSGRASPSMCAVSLVYECRKHSGAQRPDPDQRSGVAGEVMVQIPEPRKASSVCLFNSPLLPVRAEGPQRPCTYVGRAAKGSNG